MDSVHSDLFSCPSLSVESLIHGCRLNYKLQSLKEHFIGHIVLSVHIWFELTGNIKVGTLKLIEQLERSPSPVVPGD